MSRRIRIGVVNRNPILQQRQQSAGGATRNTPPGTTRMWNGNRERWTGTDWVIDYSLPTAEALAQQKASPILAALSAEEASLVDPTRRQAFAPVASRGFYGGLATGAVQRALSGLKTQFEGRRQDALSAALGQATTELGNIAAERNAEYQRWATAQANRPRFFGFRL